MDDVVSTWCGDLTAIDRRNLWRFQGWAAAWAVVFTASALLIRRWPQLVPGLPVRVALIALTIALGVAMVLAFIRFLRDADELVRKIHLESLAIAFGATVVFVTTWRLVERAGGPHADVDDSLLVMMGAWVIAQIFAARSYR
jgi:hypothetical protein